MTEMVTQHFSFKELTRTEVRLPNTPGLGERARLRVLAETLLEPSRDLILPRLGRAIGSLRVSSGYRSPGVNTAVGGAEHSAHLRGDAADVEPMDAEISSYELFEAIRASDLPFDELIFECPADCVWVHIQGAREGATPRHLVLMCLAPGRYEPFNSAAIINGGGHHG